MWYNTHPGKKRLHYKRYREKHREEILKKSKERYLKNKLSIKEKLREYYLKNQKKIYKRTRAWALKNPQKVRAYKDKWAKENIEHIINYRKQHKEKMSKKSKLYYLKNKIRLLNNAKIYYEKIRSNPKLKSQLNERKRLNYKNNPTRRRLEFRIRESRIRANGGTFSKKDWLTLLELHSNKCYYCGSSDNLTIDHMTPISRGGKNIKENIVPACFSCNFRKRTRTKEEFLKMNLHV